MRLLGLGLAKLQMRVTFHVRLKNYYFYHISDVKWRSCHITMSK